MNKLEERTIALGKLYAARAEYLSEAGWIPLAPFAKGAPVWWVDPLSDKRDTQPRWREDHAAEEQERRDNDVVYRDPRREDE